MSVQRYPVLRGHRASASVGDVDALLEANHVVDSERTAECVALLVAEAAVRQHRDLYRTWQDFSQQFEERVLTGPLKYPQKQA